MISSQEVEAYYRRIKEQGGPRGVRVAGVNVGIDADEDGAVCGLVVYILEPELPEDLTPEEKLLTRLNQSPTSCHSGPLSEIECLQVLCGEAEPHWYFDDEDASVVPGLAETD